MVFTKGSEYTTYTIRTALSRIGYVGDDFIHTRFVSDQGPTLQHTGWRHAFTSHTLAMPSLCSGMPLLPDNFQHVRILKHSSKALNQEDMIHERPNTAS